MDFIEYCHQNRILLMIYPPHSTHTLQQLNVVMFKPLSSAYTGQVAAFMERCQGLTSMSRRDSYPMFLAAWEASFKEETILKAFEATGISPFEPQVILKSFDTRQPTQGSSSDTDSSALSNSD
ncbi:pogo transposable element [Pyrenophora seminiperda CCB06]|uniref:Pogo transposable element n=1 Tax=Pyrenophora seminiperda CCB06 TaxID=1302712 RepID=A0A3M7M030_9PLEO|nr:pogo transposable element [Pyrenophora seminiperda CCB06]